jgi:hypothetical protein
MRNKVKVVRGDSTFYFAFFLWRDRIYVYTPRYTLFNQAPWFRSACCTDNRHIMQEESGSTEVKNIYKFAQVSPFPGRQVAY